MANIIDTNISSIDTRPMVTSTQATPKPQAGSLFSSLLNIGAPIAGQLSGKNVVSYAITAANTAIGGFQGKGISTASTLGMPSAPPAPPGGSYGGVSSMDSSNPYGSQVDAMFNSNMMMLELQTKVSQQSQMFQTISNMRKTEDEAKFNAIRNLKS